MPIGFFELLIIVILAIIVVGPNKLPRTIKKTLLWYRHIRDKMRDVQQDIEKSIDHELTDLKHITEESAVPRQTTIKKTQEYTKEEGHACPPIKCTTPKNNTHRV